MKKKTIILILVLAGWLFLCGFRYDLPEEILNEKDFSESLSKETLHILDEIGLSDLSMDTLENLSVTDILKEIGNAVLKKGKEPFRAVLSFLVTGILCMILQCLEDKEEDTDMACQIVGMLVLSTIILFPLLDVIRSAEKMIKECCGFMLSFISIYASTLAACGQVVTVSGYHTLVLGMVTVVSRVFSGLLVPFVSMYMALCVAGAIAPIQWDDLTRSVKNGIIWTLGLITALFSGVLGLGTLIGSSTDRLSSKAVRFMVGSGIPIVGGAVADTLATVQSCLILTKNVLGTYALVVTAILFLPQLLNVLSWRICLMIGESVLGMMDNRKLRGLFSAASSAVSILLAMLVLLAVLFIFSIAILLMAQGGTG